MLTPTLGIVTLIGIEKIVTFLVMLSILIVLHELGHFFVARRSGVRVNEFALGMGPKLAGWVSPRSGTLYSLRALPIGGFCLMEGEDNKTSEAEQQREFRAHETGRNAARSSANFQAKGPWVRLAIVVSGPAVNFLLSYVILTAGALAFGVQSENVQPIVGEVVAGTPAAIAGIRAGDRIVELNGRRVTSGKALVDTIHASLGKRLDLVYERDGVRTELYITPKTCGPSRKNWGCIGFVPFPQYERVGLRAALVQSGQQFATIADQTLGSVVLIATQFSKYANQVSGPIGIAQMSATVQDWGWGPYFSFAALISFALGFFNLLPIPALDGGRAAFIVAELLRGKPVDPEKEAMVHIAGFAALMALFLLIAFHDIARIATGNGVL
ncbi:MAG: site-2 protease family protein [Candidatus Eremiobacteraeota bacterium]|nr:site-2 protease family protein [Candidatus Eremiobacteraeota bacterium]